MTQLQPLENLHWRTLSIPVELPSRRARHNELTSDQASSTPADRQLLVSATLTCDNTSGTVYEGRAIAVQLELKAHYTWAGMGGTDHGLTFDVLPDPEDWIVLGRKKGTFAISRATAERVRYIRLD